MFLLACYWEKERKWFLCCFGFGPSPSFHLSVRHVEQHRGWSVAHLTPGCVFLVCELEPERKEELWRGHDPILKCFGSSRR